MSIVSFESVDALTPDFWHGVLGSDPAFATVKLAMSRRLKKTKRKLFEYKVILRSPKDLAIPVCTEYVYAPSREDNPSLASQAIGDCSDRITGESAPDSEGCTHYSFCRTRASPATFCVCVVALVRAFKFQVESNGTTIIPHMGAT